MTTQHDATTPHAARGPVRPGGRGAQAPAGTRPAAPGAPDGPHARTVRVVTPPAEARRAPTLPGHAPPLNTPVSPTAPVDAPASPAAPVDGPVSPAVPATVRAAAPGLAAPASGTAPAAAPAPQRTTREADGQAVGERKPRESRLLVLDGLRLAAALLVVAHHLVRGPWGAEPGSLFGPLAAVASYGWLGVNLFFLVSGFVICLSSWGRSLGEFAVSRVVRLFPAYWLGVVLTTAVLAAWPVLRGPLPAPESLVNLTMLQSGLGVTDQDWSYWSLGAELRFYLLFAVVVWLGVTYRRVVYFCALWTVVAAFSSTWDLRWVDNMIVPEFAPYFVAGTALFLVHRFGGNLLLWGLVGVNWLLALYRLASYPALEHFHLSWWSVAAAVTGCFALMTAIALGAFARVGGRWLVTAGCLTYPLYLIHQAIGQTLILGLREHVPHWLLLAGIVAVMLGAAWLIHRYVERPAGRRLRSGLNASLAAVRKG
ncbi:acyltransferase family protein [Catellatospora sp. NPDC049609]|uniref:acyltransferase family protein n=1 Tax=Catellatospora sp. NPDC049609 TaxID=3155505 RepID=UPI00342D2774